MTENTIGVASELISGILLTWYRRFIKRTWRNWHSLRSGTTSQRSTKKV